MNGQASLGQARWGRQDFLAAGILILFTLFSVSRFPFLPQFLDAYYHLACANGFLKSGGWCGVDWWSVAPVGRFHLYPPVYHLVLAGMRAAGFDGLTAVRLTEVAIVPVFFAGLWVAGRALVSASFGLFLLVFSVSFFPFYTSAVGQIPATMATLLGVFAWLAVRRGRTVSAAVALGASFYTHGAVPWLFVSSLLCLAVCEPGLRKRACAAVGGGILLGVPFLLHLAVHLPWLRAAVTGEGGFCRWNLVVLACAVAAVPVCGKNNRWLVALACGHIAGSILVFSHYPYRLFCAQGVFGFFVLASAFFSQVFAAPRRSAFAGAAVAFILICSPSLVLRDGKVRLRVVDSSLATMMRGNFGDFIENESLYSERFFRPLVEAITQNTKPDDIVGSPHRVIAAIFAALADRPSSQSLVDEVPPFVRRYPSVFFSRAVLWTPADGALPAEASRKGVSGPAWRLVAANDFAAVYIHERGGSVRPAPATVPFGVIWLCAGAAVAAVAAEFLMHRRRAPR